MRNPLIHVIVPNVSLKVKVFCMGTFDRRKCKKEFLSKWILRKTFFQDAFLPCLVGYTTTFSSKNERKKKRGWKREVKITFSCCQRKSNSLSSLFHLLFLRNKTFTFLAFKKELSKISSWRGYMLTICQCQLKSMFVTERMKRFLKNKDQLKNLNYISF